MPPHTRHTAPRLPTPTSVRWRGVLTAGRRSCSPVDPQRARHLGCPPMSVARYSRGTLFPARSPAAARALVRAHLIVDRRGNGLGGLRERDHCPYVVAVRVRDGGA